MQQLDLRLGSIALLIVFIGQGATPIGSALATELNSHASALATIMTNELREHVEVLADDSFEGREAGKRGGRAAARYLVRTFATLTPVKGVKGYSQPFGAGYQNLVGVLPGSDQKLKNEYILVGAHYDHVGYGNRRNSNGPFGYIHNGADDNASGTAAVLEMIEAFSSLDVAPKRSIVFALWDGEEKGLLGSEHWVANPPISHNRLKLAVNLDMIGRLRDKKVEVIGSRTGTGLRQIVSMSNRSSLLSLDFTWKLDDNSDHFPFFRNRVPVIMFHTGLHNDYHTPRDDAHLINHEGIHDITNLVFNVAYDVANANTTPVYRPSAQFENNGQRRDFEASRAQPMARLQMSWQEVESEDQKVLRVTRVVPGGPADLAGILVDDEILRINDRPVVGSKSFVVRVLASPASAEFVVRREGQDTPLPLKAQLQGNPTKLGITWHSTAAEPNTFTIVRVIKGSLAEHAGLRTGDRIWDVNQKQYSPSAELLKSLKDVEFPVTFTLERNGIVFTKEIEPLAEI